MPNVTLEIGTEEMPAGALAAALDQLRNAVILALSEARMEAESVVVSGTPRRLIMTATGLPVRQPDIEREARGPAKSVAFGPDGAPTGAAVGFAKKHGVSVETLESVATPQGEYVLARFTERGKLAAEVLGALLSEAVVNLYFPKMMRWGGGGMRFVRPIRWILCLLDSDVVPMEIGGVSSGRTSRGHRFLAPAEFEVDHADSLFRLLRGAYVVTDPQERRASIRSQADALALDAGGSIPWDEGLLDENVWLVEWPTAVIGVFDDKYLDLPRPVLVTAMKKHQRYFPIEGPDGGLLARFVAVRSGGDEHLDTVRDGYERVLTARFSDAAYFHKMDLESTLDEMAASLSRLIFQEKLGTMADKRLRLERLAVSFAGLFNLSEAECASLTRSASLCKADLVSRMVVELPALQGIMGREYARAAGEPMEVQAAIAEHYQPRAAGDALPSSRLGRLLALADRMDTLTGYLGVGVTPTGSSDPYGLRRAAQGAAQILADDPTAPSPSSLAAAAAEGYRSVNGKDLSDQLYTNLQALFLQRLEAIAVEQGNRYDLIDAASRADGPFADLVEAGLARCAALSAAACSSQFVLTVQTCARVSNILKSSRLSTCLPQAQPRPTAVHVSQYLGSIRLPVDPSLFLEPAERGLFEAAVGAIPDAAEMVGTSNYSGLFELLQSLVDPVNAFFDDVMVMVEDEAVRSNRLALLRTVEAICRLMADWTRIVLA